MGFIKVEGKDLWKNDAEGTWVGVQKVKTGYRYYAIKNGEITWGDFKSRSEAIKLVNRYIKSH